MELVLRSHLFEALLGSLPLLMVTVGLGGAGGPPAVTGGGPLPGTRPFGLPGAPKLGSRDTGAALLLWNTGTVPFPVCAGVPGFWFGGEFPRCSLPVLFCWLACASSSGFGSLKLGTSEYTIQNSPIFCKSPPLPVYSVRHPFHIEAYPLVRRMMSPGWMRLPSSSHTEMAMLPLLSATLHERTSCPSFVFVTRPISKTIKTILRFFDPGFTSLIKITASLEIFDISESWGGG